MSLWDTTSERFHGPSLHQAMLARGYTVDELADDAGLDRGSVHNALNGKNVRDTTAIKIFKALERRQPMLITYGDQQVA